MARVRFSGLVSSVEGSVGGVTFQRGRGGSMVKARGRPVTSSTQASGDARANLALARRVWRSMWDFQRRRWDALADQVRHQGVTHSVGSPGGRDAFIAYWLRRHTFGLSPGLLPPPTSRRADVGQVIPIWGPGAHKLGVVVAHSAPPGRLFIWIARTYRKWSRRPLSYTQVGTYPMPSSVLWVEYGPDVIAAVGEPEIAEFYWVRISYAPDDGLDSPFIDTPGFGQP